MGAALLPCKVVRKIGGDHARECWCLRPESLETDSGLRIHVQVIYKGNALEENGRGIEGSRTGKGGRQVRG